MKIDFTGHGIEVTPAIKQLSQEKFTRLERHFDHINSIHVTFAVEKLNQIAEATVLVTKGELHAKAISEDLYRAIDELVDKLDKQLIKHKEKIQDHRT